MVPRRDARHAQDAGDPLGEDPIEGTTQAADGTRLAYRVVGRGPPLVLANGVSTSEFFWRRILPHWTPRFRVLVWDYKGHGRSEPARTRHGTTIEALADDFVRVMDACNIERAPAIGFSMGSQVVLEACRHHPTRFPAVVSLLGTARRLFDTALWRVGGRTVHAILTATPRRARPILRRAVHVSMRLPWTYRVGRAVGLYGAETGVDDVRAYVDHFGQLDPATVTDIVLAAGTHDATDVVARLPMPLLVIAGDRDVFAPVGRVSRPIADAAPGSRLEVIPDGTHGSLFGHAAEVERLIDDFLAEVCPARDWG